MASLERYYETPPNGSFQLSTLLLEEEVSSLYQPPPDSNTLVVQDKVSRAVFSEQPSTAALSGRQILRRFQADMFFEELGSTLSVRTLEVTSTFMQGALAFAGPAGGVASAVLGTTTGWIKEAMLKRRFESAKSKLSIDLDRYRKENRDGFRALLEAPGSDDEKGFKRYNILYGEDHPVLNPDLDNVPEEARGLIQGTLIKMLADADKVIASDQRRLWDELAEMGEELTNQGKKIEDFEGEITRIDNAFIQFAKDTETKFSSLETEVREIGAGLAKVHQSVIQNERRIAANSDNIAENRKLIRKNASDVQYLQGFLFDKMDPSEQIAALKNGFFDGMDQGDRENLKEKIQLAEKRQNLVSSISSTINGANDLMGIAGKLGISVPDEIQTAVKAGTSLLNAGLSFTSGNYIGAIRSVTELFGLGKKKVDIGAQRHKQVMGALSQLAQGQHKILQNQGTLLNMSALHSRQNQYIMENQRVMLDALNIIDQKLDQMMKNQRAIYESIENLSAQLRHHHEFVMNRLAEIVDRLVLIQFSIKAANLQGMSNARTAFKHMFGLEGYLPNKNRFLSYEALTQFYETFKNDLAAGLETLSTQSANAGSETDAAFFMLDDLEVPSDQVDQKEAAIRLYTQTMQYVKMGVGNQNNPALIFLFASLIHPSPSVATLNTKLSKFKEEDVASNLLPNRLQQIVSPSHPTPHPPSVSRLLARLYDPNLTHEFSELALRLHYFFELYQGTLGSNLRTVEDLKQRALEGKENSKRGQIMLEDCMVRLDVAIAQQSLLQGDALLPQFAHLLQEGRNEGNEQRYDQMIQLFNTNYFLASNAVMYTVREIVKDRHAEYIQAISQVADDPNLLKALIGTFWRYHWNSEDKVWCINIGERKDEKALPLPATVELMGGKLMQTPALSHLLNVRKTVAQEVSSYNFQTRGTASERRLYMQSLAQAV